MAPSFDPKMARKSRVPQLRLLSVLGLGLTILTFVVSTLAFAQLDTAPPSWDEAYLTQLPHKLLRAGGDGSPLEVVQTWYGTRFFKPPLSMLGSAMSMAAFGTDAVGRTLDNLVVSLGSAYLAFLFLARFGSRHTAATTAALFTVSPCMLMFARVELAEVYVVGCTTAFLTHALSRPCLQTTRGSAGLGLLAGLGVTAKLSFPLIGGPVALWLFFDELRTAWRGGKVKALLGRTLLAIGLAVTVVFTLCGENFRHCWRNLKAQYGWAGDQLGGEVERLSLDHLAHFATTWADFLGWIWVILLVLTPLVFLQRRRQTAAPAAENRATGLGPSTSSVIGALVLTILVNLAVCYHFPVIDPRFTVGAIVAAVLLVGIAASIFAQQFPALVYPATLVVTIVALTTAWSNTFLSADPQHPVLRVDLPHIGRLPAVLPPPCRDPDLRPAVLDALPEETRRIALAGDHRSLNIENLRLLLWERKLAIECVQIGYLGDLPLPERIAKAGAVQAWVLCLPPLDAPPGLWTQLLGRPALQALAARWQRQDIGQLPDGTEVVVLR